MQERSVKLNDELRKTLGTVKDVAEAPGTNAALRGLTATVTTLNPQLRFYGPYVTVCNSWNYFFTYLAEHFSEPDTTGSAQRALVNTTGQQEDSLGAMGADEPANGKGVIEGTPQYAQDQPYGAAIGRRRARRLRGRPARLRRAPGALLPGAVQDHPRPALGRPAGPDVRRPRARARGPDVHRRAGDRPVLGDAGLGAPMRLPRSNMAIGLVALAAASCSSTSASPRRSR